MNAAQPATEKAAQWSKTQYANLIRYVPSGRYFARIRVRGKLIRKSLKTTRVSVAKLRLADLEKEEREKAENQTSVISGKMTFNEVLAIYRGCPKTDMNLKPRSKEYREERISAPLRSWPELNDEDEIGKQLTRRGKRLIVYLPGAHTGADPTVKRLLGLGTDGYADRHNRFIRDYSVKLGRLGSGWWFDSCNRQDNAAWQKETDACRAGNPDSVIAFSGAEFCASGGQIRPQCPIEDYHAGEIHLLEDGKIRTDFIYPPGEDIMVSADRKLRKKGQEAKFYMPKSQFIDNVQWHCLLPIDLTFNPAVPDQYCHYTDKELFQFVDDVKAVGGAITINVPIETENGRIPEDTHAQLVRLGQHLQASPKK